ncbi:MAG: epoxyqueuosine reductase QueH [Candidatus Woesearchaeota archaeon]
MKRLLLHTCCAPCSTHAIELLKDKYEVVLFFSNSNIFPRGEYEKRLDNARKIASVHGLELVEDDYDHESWLSAVKGLESEPEGGKRCLECFRFNIRRARDCAWQRGFDLFTTTLTISPHKDSGSIIRIGHELGGQRAIPQFLPVDLKKNDGFRRSTELSRKHGLYRQGYCGCEFSMRG